MPSLMMMTLIVSEESLPRDRHSHTHAYTRTHTHKLGVVYRELFQSIIFRTKIRRRRMKRRGSILRREQQAEEHEQRTIAAKMIRKQNCLRYSNASRVQYIDLDLHSRSNRS